LRRHFEAVLLFAVICVTNTYAAAVVSSAQLNANDTLDWSQLGPAGAAIPAHFTASSSHGIPVIGILEGSGGGTVARACPAPGCNYAGDPPAFNPGDPLLWAENSAGSGSGPLLLTLSKPVLGLGFNIQLTAPGSFSVLFEAISGPTSTFQLVNSDSVGDPVFLGVLDPTPDVSGLFVQIAGCTPSSPGTCDPSDFAISNLALATPVPEPGTFVPMLLGAGFLLLVPAAKRVRIPPSSLLSLLLLLCAGLSTRAQTPSLPLWHYQITSPVNGLTYRGYMVGTSPFNRGARTTTIPVILIPFIVNFQNTTTGFTAIFDPSSNPDPGCTAGQTMMALVENSPLFVDQDWTFNGVYAGHTQYIDAFQRANFWEYAQNTGDAYHVRLNYTEAEPLSVDVSYATAGPAAGVATGLASSCTNPSVRGTTNAAGFQGSVDIATLRTAMENYIAEHSITPDQLPVFILYNVVQYVNQTASYGGYHFSTATYPESLISPGQTFIVANFRTTNGGAKDVSILSHELAEWVNDPSGRNAVLSWGHIGQVTGCQSALEVGDPLTGTLLPVITGPNGFDYHVQELAYFSWFFRTPSTGAGSALSNNGTLTANAGAVCRVTP
jgi:hypothetical protein